MKYEWLRIMKVMLWIHNHDIRHARLDISIELGTKVRRFEKMIIHTMSSSSSKWKTFFKWKKFFFLLRHHKNIVHGLYQSQNVSLHYQSHITENTSKLQTTFDDNKIFCAFTFVYVPSFCVARLSIAMRCTCRHGIVPEMLNLGTFRTEMSTIWTKPSIWLCIFLSILSLCANVWV